MAFQGEGRNPEDSDISSIRFQENGPEHIVWLGKGGKSSKWLQPHPAGPRGCFPKAQSSRAGQYFINWARSFEDKAWEVRAPTLSGFELKKPLNQAQKRTRRQRTQARTRTGAPSEQNESLSAGVVSPSALKTGPAATSLVTWAPRTVYSWHRRVALFRQQLLASNPEPTLFGQR